MLKIGQAERLLKLSDNSDYIVTQCYENGFKAQRTNEWIKTELYCEVFTDPDRLDQANLYDYISIATMVIERYK